MNSFRWLPGLLLPLLVVGFAAADDKTEEGFVPMFNGRDLTGWVNVNCAPSTFYVKDGEIITTGKPTGYLRTEKQYENFVAEFDWMHVPAAPGAVGNSGFFVWCDPIPAVGTGYTRGIEVQVLVNLTHKNKKGEVTATSEGDLFSIHGATCVPDRPHPDGWARCLPSGDYCKGELEWNHYRVEANDGRITLAVNGHVVSGVSKCNPRKGYLALESEGSECHFRNLKIKELPSTNPKPGEVADEAKGFVKLYNGLDLAGWKSDEGTTKHWQAKDTVLRADGEGAEDQALWTDREYADFELIVDWRPMVKAPRKGRWNLLLRGAKGVRVEVEQNGWVFYYAPPGAEENWECSRFDDTKPAGQWNRLHVRLKGKDLETGANGKPDVERLQVPAAAAARGPVGLRPAGAPVEFANLFIRELK
jgi:Domain of Unknown Function (DUF1080)